MLVYRTNPARPKIGYALPEAFHPKDHIVRDWLASRPYQFYHSGGSCLSNRIQVGGAQVGPIWDPGVRAIWPFAITPP